MATEAALELRAIRTRNLAPTEVAVLGVPTIHSGVRVNIPPDLVTLSGTTRSFDDKIDVKVERRVREIAQSVAQANGASAEIKFYDQTPVLISGPALAKRSLPALERSVGAANVTLTPPIMAAEDLGKFAVVAPEFHFDLGTFRYAKAGNNFRGKPLAEFYR